MANLICTPTLISNISIEISKSKVKICFEIFDSARFFFNVRIKGIGVDINLKNVPVINKRRNYFRNFLT